MDVRVEPQPICVRVVAVIVLYKMMPQCSASFTSLLDALAKAPTNALQLKILLYDNTPGGQDPGPLPDGVQYRAASINAGLAEAYNEALALAEVESYDWLLTLDQDTLLPLRYLCRVAEIAREFENTPSVAAVVPQITGGARMLSPNWFLAGAVARWFKEGFVGVSAQATYAFNSASTIRVTALRQIGGYSPWFWLDNSDAYMFRKLSRYGKQVYVAGDIQVAHDFSMMDMQSRITPSRYRNILLAESAFWDLEMGVLAGLERTARLTLRLFKHFRRKDSPELRDLTREFLWRRLAWTRRSRIAAWEKETRDRFPELPENRVHFGTENAPREWRSKISVCMAAYNGEKYVEEQLKSILCQLGENDEVIVVDDASTDSTKDRIRSLNDARIRLIENQRNCGVVTTVEDAIRNATGTIIFLADDDDIWASTKVEKVLDMFKNHPEAQIVTTGVSLIDQHGRPSGDMIYSDKRIFRAGFWSNIVRNNFQGSAMAFRASMLHCVLPFPKRVDFYHDQWMATRNAICGGSVVYIDEPLLLYRRHSQNLSRRRTKFMQLKVRVQLLWAHFLRLSLVRGSKS